LGILELSHHQAFDYFRVGVGGFVTSGGPTGYGPDTADLFRRAASYVDRILKDDKATGLPVEAPTKFELMINLKTAKTLGLTVPATLLSQADRLFE
jgi:putative ABC transport system substrate-binding protein